MVTSVTYLNRMRIDQRSQGVDVLDLVIAQRIAVAKVAAFNVILNVIDQRSPVVFHVTAQRLAILSLPAKELRVLNVLTNERGVVH